MSLSSRKERERKSDQIRNRRSHQSQDWLRRVTQRAEKIAERPPALNQERLARDCHKSDHGFQLLLKIKQTKGAKNQINKFQFSWRILSFLLTALFTAGIFIGWNSPRYRVSIVKIDGLQRLDSESILASLDILGQRIFLIEPAKIRESIAKDFPELKEIKISISLPDQVKVSTIERQPELAWKYENHTLWVDAEGYLLPPRGNAGDLLTIISDKHPPFYIPDYHISLAGEKKLHKSLIIKGDSDKLALFKFYKRIDPSLYQAVLELETQLPEEKNLLYDSRHGLGWYDTRGWQVFIGMDLDKLHQKMSKYGRIVEKLAEQEIQPTLINVEYINAPYYRLN